MHSSAQNQERNLNVQLYQRDYTQGADPVKGRQN